MLSTFGHQQCQWELLVNGFICALNSNSAVNLKGQKLRSLLTNRTVLWWAYGYAIWYFNRKEKIIQTIEKEGENQG